MFFLCSTVFQFFCSSQRLRLWDDFRNIINWSWDVGVLFSTVSTSFCFGRSGHRAHFIILLLCSSVCVLKMHCPGLWKYTRSIFGIFLRFSIFGAQFGPTVAGRYQEVDPGLYLLGCILCFHSSNFLHRKRSGESSSCCFSRLIRVFIKGLHMFGVQSWSLCAWVGKIWGFCVWNDMLWSFGENIERLRVEGWRRGRQKCLCVLSTRGGKRPSCMAESWRRRDRLSGVEILTEERRDALVIPVTVNCQIRCIKTEKSGLLRICNCREGIGSRSRRVCWCRCIGCRHKQAL